MTEEESNSDSEYAEQYTRRERVRFVVLAIAFGGGFMLLWHQWALPLWADFVRKSPCVQLAGLKGSTWMFYGLLVGLPLLSAIVVAALFGRRGVKILRDDQVPYKGEKVFNPTKIRRGRKARFIGWMHVLAPLLFIVLAVAELPQARRLTADLRTSVVNPSACESRDAEVERSSQ